MESHFETTIFIIVVVPQTQFLRKYFELDVATVTDA